MVIAERGAPGERGPGGGGLETAGGGGKAQTCSESKPKRTEPDRRSHETSSCDSCNLMADNGPLQAAERRGFRCSGSPTSATNNWFVYMSVVKLAGWQSWRADDESTA